MLCCPAGSDLARRPARHAWTSLRLRHRAPRARTQKLLFINAHKLAGSRPVVVPGSDGLSSGATTSGRPGTACSNASSASSQQKWMLPSGAFSACGRAGAR